jgi:amidase
MDCTQVKEGAKLYFPVSAPGALFATGDLHIVMGDGEVGGSGLEIPADITLSLEIIKGKSYEFPIAEDDSNFCIIATEPTLDKATESCMAASLEFLKDKIDLESHQIIMLMSLAGDLQISQVVDPEMTVRFTFPKECMDKIEF